MKFNSNRERREYWKSLIVEHTELEIKKAIESLKPDTARVLILHYRNNHSFREITSIMNRSITVIRNHHNRGIYKLYRHFNPRSTEIA